MKRIEHKQAVILGLRNEILKLQGFKISPDEHAVDFGLGHWFLLFLRISFLLLPFMNLSGQR